MRDRGGELVDLNQYGIVEDPVDREMEVVLDKDPDDGMGGDEVNLKLAVRGDLPLPLQHSEHVVGLSGDVRIEQVIERHVGDCLAWAKAITGATFDTCMQTKFRSGLFESGMIGEQRLEPCDPVQSLSRLSIGNSKEML